MSETLSFSSYIAKPNIIVKKVFPVAVLTHALITGLVGCTPQEKTTSNEQHPVSNASPLFPVHTSPEQYQQALAIINTIQQSLADDDAAFDLVVSTTAHLSLPFGKKDPTSLLEQQYLLDLRKTFAYQYLQKDEAFTELDRLLASIQQNPVPPKESIIRIMGLLAHVALVEKDAEK